MSEKRKPKIILLASKIGQRKKSKVEIFEAKLFVEHVSWQMYNRYRLRVNGRWFPKGTVAFYTKTEIKNLYFKAINF